MSQHTTESAVNSTSPILLRVAVLGDRECGKSSFLEAVASGNAFFQERYVMTLGLDFKVWRTACKDPRSDATEVPVKVQVWDTAVRELLAPLPQSLVKNRQAALLCFDLSNERSLENIEKKWYPFCQKYAESNTQYLLLGMKADLPNIDGLQYRAQRVADRLGLEYRQCSSKQFTGVIEVMEHLVNKTLYSDEVRLTSWIDASMAQSEPKPEKKSCTIQ